VTTRRRIAVIVAWLVATALLVVCARTIDWRHAIEMARTARPGWLALSVMANTAIICLWAVFWGLLVPRGEGRAGYWRMFEVVSVASSLMNTVPFGGGHASSVVLLVRRTGQTHRGALSVLALDQLGEGIAKVLAVLAMKAAEIAGIVAVQHAFGLSVSVGGTLLVFAAVVLATMLPVAPANLGTYEASAFLAYRYLGFDPAYALGIAVIQHVCYLIATAGLGYLLLSARTFSRSAIASQ